MKCAIYVRVSTDEQNIDQQRDMLVKFCKDREYTYRSYLDDGVSGKISDRPGWNKLLSDAEAGKFDAILVSKIDRITRDLKYALELLDWYDINNVKLISLYDSMDLSSPDGRFAFKLKCLLSEYELEQLAWRRQIGIERAKKEGKYKGRKPGSTNKLKI